MDDKEKKLRIQIIVTIVVAVLLTAAMSGVWAMKLISPLNEQIKTESEKLTQLKTQADTLGKAKQDLEDARVKEKHLDLQLAFFRNRYRSFDFGTWDPAKNDGKNPQQVAIWRKWMHEWSYDYGPRLWGEIYGAANASGVRISKLDDIKTEAPPKGPENIYIPPNGFFKPTGPDPLNITVTGTLDEILTFMRRIHEGQILMKVGGGLKLEGSSPRVTTTFTIQPYLVAKGQHVALSAAGAAPAGGAAPAAGAPAAGASGETPAPTSGP